MGRLKVPGATGASNWNRHGQTGGTRSYRNFKLEQTRQIGGTRSNQGFKFEQKWTGWRFQEVHVMVFPENSTRNKKKRFFEKNITERMVENVQKHRYRSATLCEKSEKIQ